MATGKKVEEEATPESEAPETISAPVADTRHGYDQTTGEFRA